MRFDGIFDECFGAGPGWSAGRAEVAEARLAAARARVRAELAAVALDDPAPDGDGDGDGFWFGCAGLDDVAAAGARVAWSTAAACDPQAGALGPAGLVIDQVIGLADGALCASERFGAAAVLAAVEAERRGLPGLDGRAGLRAWLVRRFALAGADAGRLARQARFVVRHPDVGVALAAGTIRLAHLAAIVATVAADLEALFDECWDWLADAATSLDPDGFAIVMRTWRAHADQDRPPPDPAARTRLRAWAGADGLGHLDVTLDPEGWEVVLAALERHDRPDPVDGLLPPRSRSQRLAEQLVQIARFALTHDRLPHDDDEPPDDEPLGDEPVDDEPVDGGSARPTPTRSKARSTINVFADLEILHPDWLDALPLATRMRLRSTLERFGPITPATAQRLACDSYLSRILTKARSVVLDMGFRTETFTDAQRRAIHAEFPTCPCGCGTPAAQCDLHHIDPHDPANRRGPTDLTNGVPLCRRAHILVHDQHRTIRRVAPGKVLFVPRD